MKQKFQKKRQKTKIKDNTKQTTVHKKRGRKPAGKIIKLASSEYDKLQNDEDCLIGHIPLNNIDISNVTSLVNNTDSDTFESLINKNISTDFQNKYVIHLEKKIKKLSDEINSINNLNKLSIFYKDYSIEKLNSKIFTNKNNKYILNKSTNIHCWWCCHSFKTTPFPLPNKYYNNNYHVFGNFCSPSCACAYNIDLNDHKIWERNTLILKLYNELTNDNLRNIYPAPPKQILKVFGGNIDIDEFRSKTNNSYSSRFIVPPMLPITTLIEECYKDRNKYEWNNKVNLSKYNNLKKTIKISRGNKNDNLNSIDKIMGLKN